MIHKTTLKNGIRVVAEEIPYVKSVAIGLWVNVGSRDERQEEHGISHFLEHMFFKGTEKRTAKDIALEMDAIGGELNAFTSRENTTFYAKVLDEDLPKAIDLLFDNFSNSKFDSKEIEKEREVIIEEIKMCEDDPEDLVHEMHLNECWTGHPLARSILGTIDGISRMTRDKITRYLSRTYDPCEMIISVAGRFEMSGLTKRLEASFGQYVAEKIDLQPRQPPSITPHIQVKQKKLEQVHLLLTTQGIPQGDDRRYPLFVLNTILGGGVSSRLFQEVRERQGWAYSIYSSPSSYQDSGLFTVYAGTSPKNTLNVIEVILRELSVMKVESIEIGELERAKSYLKGSLMLSMESTGSRMSRLAKEELCFGRTLSLKEITEEINKVSVDQVQQLANSLFQKDGLSMTALGDLPSETLQQDFTL